jgi:hypothetical protein
MWEIDHVITSRTCLLPMINPESRQLLRLYDHYKNNLLPFAGGILDQPQKFLTAMRTIDGYLSNRRNK